MRNFFTERAALCASTAELLRALGDVGDAAQKSGYLNIMQAIELFRVVVSAPDGTSHTSLVELLHRLERDEMIEATFGERPKAAENARDASVLAPSAPSSRHLSIATGVFPNVRPRPARAWPAPPARARPPCSCTGGERRCSIRPGGGRTRRELLTPCVSRARRRGVRR